jgi:predicted TIM-barrel fold metal-dependent hydrolase
MGRERSRVKGKIAIEEHFLPPGRTDLLSSPGWSPEAMVQIARALTDTEDRLALMDEGGVEMAVLSLASDGIQNILDPGAASETAREANDALRAVVATHPDRYAGFAALPMQDPLAAAAELDRAITELKFCGALVNGYSNLGDLDTALYYDDPIYDPLWERMVAHDVPLYLHPRNPLPSQRRIYAGRAELLGPTWAFGAETAVHALRMIVGGVFDRFPQLKIILGHLGELLPFAIRRLEQRMSRLPDVTLERPPSSYLRENFWITTSGNYHTPSLVGILLELGSERLVFAADYPFEHLHDGTEWIDTVPISDRDRALIGRENVKRLLRL